MIFSEASLDRSAERGGDKHCKSCGAMALFLVLEVVGPEWDKWELEYCPACRKNPLRRRWMPKQGVLPLGDQDGT